MDLSTTAKCIHKILLQAALVKDLGRLEWLQILHFLHENFQPPRHGTHATLASPLADPASTCHQNERKKIASTMQKCPNQLAWMHWPCTTALHDHWKPGTGSSSVWPIRSKKPVDCDLSSNCQSNASPRNPNTSNERDLLETTFFWSGSWATCLPTLAQEATNWVLGAFLRPNPPNDRTQTGCCSTTHKCGVGRPQWCTDISRVLNLMMSKCGHQFRSDDSQEEVRSVQQERAGVAQKRMHGAPCA